MASKSVGIYQNEIQREFIIRLKRSDTIQNQLP